MIPFIQIPSVSFGGIEFHAFGILVATGIYVGARLAARRAQRTGLDPRVIYDAALIAVFFGFLGAHFVHLAAYYPQRLFSRPWEILYIWAGISSFGGFLGAGVALAFYFHKTRRPFLPYADALMFGLLPGWFFGRLGCTLAHDHPGRLTDFFLAVQFPGGARHDLGFYEWLLTIDLLVFLWILSRLKGFRAGAIFAIMTLAYAIPRFFLDYLRATDHPLGDARYWGHTPGQYVAVGLVIFSAILILRKRLYLRDRT